jgi:hypothetical protein
MASSELTPEVDERRAYLQVLEQGTLLVESLLAHQIQMVDFVRQYNDFYYLYALHGDEATEAQREVIGRHSELCKLHEEIQRVVYLVYFADSPVPNYESMGRMLPQRARQVIVDAVQKAGGLANLLTPVRHDML